MYLFDKYSKTTVTKTVISEKLSFAQTNKQNCGDNNSSSGNNQEYNPKYWENKTCFNCDEKNYSAYVYSNTKNTNDDDKSTASSVKKMNKKMYEIAQKQQQTESGDESENEVKIDCNNSVFKSTSMELMNNIESMIPQQMKLPILS